MRAKLEHRIAPFFAILAVASLLSACAGNETRTTTSAPATSNIERVSVADYRVFLADLRETIQAGEPREFNNNEMRRYQRIDNRLNALLENYQSIDEMSQDERRELFNLHEDLQALVIGRDEDQVICRRQQTVGTHFRNETCRTRSEWREEQEEGRRLMRNMFSREAIDPSSIN